MNWCIPEAGCVFVICFLVYLANERTIPSGDTVPNTLIALNWLFNHSLDLEFFRHSYLTEHGVPYYFSESQHARLTSTYPIGPAIISFPIYLCFYLVLLLSKNFHVADLATAAFEVQLLSFEKIAASVIASLSAVIFYQLSRLKFARSVAIISTFVYAFATNAWVISSQGLWQHGSTNLVLLSIFLCLFKANRSEQHQRRLLLAAGLFCGLLLGIRPTNVLFFLPIAIYSIFTYRQKFFYLLLGLPSLFPSIGWNIYHFGNLTGGYTTLLGGYILTVQRFCQGFLGLLISPSRGLFVYSPILLYAIPGMFQIGKLRAGKDEKLLLCLLPSCLILVLQYSVFRAWWAGHGYGPRFLTDVLPILCFSINYVIDFNLRSRHFLQQKLFDWRTCLFLSLLVVSVFVQTVGAFGVTQWESLPVNIDFNEEVHSGWRLWNIRDTQIERHTQGVLTAITIPRKSQYVLGYAGKILEIRDAQRQPITSPLLVKARSKIVLKAKVQNTGTQRWLGYQSSALRGEVRVRVRLRDASNHEIDDQRLYVSGRPKNQEVAEALGMIEFPTQPGRYKLLFNLIGEGFSDLPSALSKPGSISPIELEVKVE